MYRTFNYLQLLYDHRLLLDHPFLKYLLKFKSNKNKASSSTLLRAIFGGERGRDARRRIEGSSKTGETAVSLTQKGQRKEMILMENCLVLDVLTVEHYFYICMILNWLIKFCC